MQFVKRYSVQKKAEELEEKVGMRPDEAKREILGNVEQAAKDTKEEEDDNDGGKNDSPNLNSEMRQQKAALQSMGIGFAMEEEDLSQEELQSKELSAMADFLKLEALTKPVVVYGESGTGKTSLMARMATICDSWLEREPVKIIRYLGTSAPSTTIRSVLVGICEQIWENYDNVKCPSVDISKDFTFLTLYLQSLLMRVNSADKPLVIILDSIDQLSEDDYAHGMAWLPTVLPPNVHMVISMVPELKHCLENTRRVLEEEHCFIEVPPLPRDTASNILTNWCNSIGRSLTNEQQDYILSSLWRCPQPMFLKMSFEEARQWKSYTPRDDWAVGHTVSAAIEQMFQRLERDHGYILVSKALGEFDP